MAHIDNDEIIAQLKDPRTQRKAFEVVVNTQSRQLYWQIHHILQNHDDTDDVLQNTFVKAWKGLDTFKGDSALSTWLYKIAYNEAITWLKRNRENISIDDENYTGASTFVADEYFDGDNTEQILQEAISTLPAKQKLVFGMKYFDGKKYEEMSEMLGTSVGALKASYHLAVEKISNYVKKKQ